ncbi:MAG: mannose-6-phosphate isomerase, class I [Eubacterium sp.]|nr:mannose-6-phosphate isomerase, class I [Eubacterium sp.]
MMDAIFLHPVFKQMIWGGRRLATDFGYDIPGDDTGECWAISAHQNGDCVIAGGEYDGMHLSELWRTHGELFGRGDTSGEDKEPAAFPLLTKIIDANDNLSIQVHPDDEYAREHENAPYGKTECWYVLDADEGAGIIIGHNARTREELIDMIDNGRWSELIREVPVKKGDFFQIPPGTVHAIKKGTLILETQQNSDITYRLYDYDRLSDGKPRELHLKQSKDVIRVPFEPTVVSGDCIPTENPWFEELIHCELYVVWRACIGREGRSDKYVLKQDRSFMLVSVTDGQGMLGNIPIKKGHHLILPCGFQEAVISGDLELIVSSV